MVITYFKSMIENQYAIAVAEAILYFLRMLLPAVILTVMFITRRKNE
jgi:hypothetical protein